MLGVRDGAIVLIARLCQRDTWMRMLAVGTAAIGVCVALASGVLGVVQANAAVTSPPALAQRAEFRRSRHQARQSSGDLTEPEDRRPDRPARVSTPATGAPSRTYKMRPWLHARF